MIEIAEDRYGKSRVRLMKVTRHPHGNDLREWTVEVLLQGDFDAAHTAGDNANILPTDTMKNTVYSIARGSIAATIEDFAMELGDYVLTNNPQVSKVSIEIEEKNWKRLKVDGEPDATTFKLGGPELQTVQAVRVRAGGWGVTSGVDGLTILKTTKSAFTGYINDRLTTLKPAKDRIFGTRATISWDYLSAQQNYAEVRARIIAALLKEFAAHHSMSVQHTLFDMGKAALAASPEIARIHLTMPNLHHLLADLSPFGQENPNHILVPIDEPHGFIEATIER